MIDATVIYYSSNREPPAFEHKILETLQDTCYPLPLITVTQKPVPVGENHVIGDVGVSGFNACRQILIGCLIATTKYVISAEADALYPPDYFTVVPPKDDVAFRSTQTYIIGNRRTYYFHKREGSLFAQVINRKFYIARLSMLFEGAPMWSKEEKNFPKERGFTLFEPGDIYTYDWGQPCVSFKINGMRHFTHSDRNPIQSLPYWGDARELRKKFVNDRWCNED